MSQSAGLFGEIAQFMSEITGATKTAAAESEPGSIGGETSHPSKSVDDSLQTAAEGSHSKDNEKVVEEQIGAPAVNKASDNASDQDSHQLNLGTDQTSTGNDPAVEDKYKDTKEDPGTSHPAKVGAEKFASLSFEKKASLLGELGNRCLAHIVRSKTAAAPAATPVAPAATTKEAADAAAAGYDLAAVLGMADMTPEQRAIITVEQTVKEASFDADLVIDFYKGFKQAMDDEASASEDNDKPGDEGTGGAPPPEGGAPAGGAGGGGDLAAMLGGGGDPAAAGGAPPPAPGGGGDLGAMLGGAPGGMPGGMPGGDPAAGGMAGASDEEKLHALTTILMELGIAPEALVGAMPTNPEGAQKIASAVIAYKRSGRFSIKEAKTQAQRELRDEMKKVVREIVGA
jgi:hypothetical protein